MTIKDAQKLRKKGYWVLTNGSRTKVLKVSKSYKKICNHVAFGSLWSPLQKIVVTKSDARKYEKIQESIWINKNSEVG